MHDERGPQRRGAASRDNDPESYCFVAYRVDGEWSFDGPHGINEPLDETICLLQRIGKPPDEMMRVFYIRDRYGTLWPEFESLNRK
jgi:hypothetical protein